MCSLPTPLDFCRLSSSLLIRLKSGKLRESLSNLLVPQKCIISLCLPQRAGLRNFYLIRIMDFFEAQDRAKRQTTRLVIYYVLAVLGIIGSLYVITLDRKSTRLK